MPESKEQHDFFMDQALKLALLAKGLGEVPVGAVVIHEGKIIGQGYNQKETQKNIFYHAEITALNEAQKTLDRWRLNDCFLYSSLEPCFMCAAALVHARIAGLFFGARDSKFGGIVSLYQMASDSRLNHRFTYEEGIRAKESGDLLKNFFKDIRKNKSMSS